CARARPAARAYAWRARMGASRHNQVPFTREAAVGARRAKPDALPSCGGSDRRNRLDPGDAGCPDADQDGERRGNDHLRLASVSRGFGCGVGGVNFADSAVAASTLPAEIDAFETTGQSPGAWLIYDGPLAWGAERGKPFEYRYRIDG